MNESGLSDAALAELVSLTIEVDECSTTIYRNHLGQIHRVHGPAIEFVDGTKAWYQNDMLHRTDGPAYASPFGFDEWWLDGEVVREWEWNERVKSI